MIDIEQIKQNPDAFRRAIRLKAVLLDLDELLEIEQQRRGLVDEVNNLRARRNRLTELVAAGGADRQANIVAAREVGAELATKEPALQVIENRYASLMSLVPGLPLPDVPEGLTDADNVEVRRFGEPTTHVFQLLDHLELATMHAMVEFEGAREAAGSRAYALKGNGALLEMAVMRLAMDLLLAKGFVPVLPPLMVRENAMFGTGYFPLGEDNAYQLEKDKLFLTGTSEVGVVAMHANRTFDAEDLPQRFAGISTCFRREAGAAGRDTRGLYRVHQFQKVEQVVFCVNDAAASEKEHFDLLANAEAILQALELPYRVVAVCTGDMGLGQVRKHDIETWMPSRQAYGETHSCSTFNDFQARRLGIRYRDGKRKPFVHTLNNTAIASPRILIALLENHQNADGTINIPKALQAYLGGVSKLNPGRLPPAS